VNPQHVQLLWAELNIRWFGGRLPSIEIVWSRRLTASAGMFVSHGGPRSLEAGARRRSIRLSVPLLQAPSEQAARDVFVTLAHEMIHQWQFDILKRRPNHGPDFRRKMDEMNGAGLGITVRHALTESVRKRAKYAWQCLRCGRTYERQRRTIRPSRHRCGACRGALRETSPLHDTMNRAPGDRTSLRRSAQTELDF